MLRIATIASLVVLNVAVWLGPAETLLARSGDTYAVSAHLERVDDRVGEGDLGGALHLLQQLVDTYPDNAVYRYELGVFQHMHADFLSTHEKMDMRELARTAHAHMQRACELAPDDAQLASNCAVLLMDVGFFGDVVARDDLMTAWERVRYHATARQDSGAEWHFYADSVANVLLQQARIEARFGNIQAARMLVDEARAYSPRIHIPKAFIEHNRETRVQ